MAKKTESTGFVIRGVKGTVPVLTVAQLTEGYVKARKAGENPRAEQSHRARLNGEWSSVRFLGTVLQYAGVKLTPMQVGSLHNRHVALRYYGVAGVKTSSTPGDKHHNQIPKEFRKAAKKVAAPALVARKPRTVKPKVAAPVESPIMESPVMETPAESLARATE